MAKARATLQSRARDAVSKVVEPQAQDAILGFANVLVAGLDFFSELENGKTVGDAAAVAGRKYKRRSKDLRKVRKKDSEPVDE